jgi:ATP-dependent Clp protease ATP-binding subunit ClpX
MEQPLAPKDIYNHLAARVRAQEDVLRKVSVAVYKHVSGIRAGNLLLIGNSGTGKTTIMQAVRSFYETRQDLRQFRAMAIMNANMLVGDREGEVETSRLFKNLERVVKNLEHERYTTRTLKEHIENATVCVDEVDKISAKITSTTPNVYGIAVQNALLTIIGGETVLFDTTTRQDGDEVKIRLPIDTSKMLFICAGAFETLYDQVYDAVLDRKDRRELKEETRIDLDGQLKRVVPFSLRDYLEYQDLFAYGMMPQFISRFGSIAVLDDLTEHDLLHILMRAPESPYQYSRKYFAAMGIELVLAPDAQNAIAMHAANNTRVGARALWHVFSKIIADLEFDPQSSPLLESNGNGGRIVIDRATVKKHLYGE